MIWFVAAGREFFAISAPVPANVLVVEEWVWQSAAMQEAAEEFNRGRYDVVGTVGVISEWEGSGRTGENSAALGAEQLRKLGVDDPAIAVRTVPRINRHRTFASALAVKRWLARSQTDAVGVNVFTLGAHARKSLVLFKGAFVMGIPVGVIAGTGDWYDPKRGWLSGRGIYTVVRKTAGYLHAEWWPLPDDLLASTG